MSSASTPAPAAQADGAQKPKSRRGLLLVATAVIVLLGGGGAAYWMYARGPEAPAEAEAEPVHEEEPGVAVPFEPFVVNLADLGGNRFLRVNLSLIVNEEHALEFEENPTIMARVRSAILELLAQQTADPLITPDGKTALKKAIAEGAAHAVEGLHVSDVLFSEFVVQF
jgi:flagellar FliL protein